METNSISVVFIQKPLCNICGPLQKKKKTSSDFRSELEQKRGRAQRSEKEQYFS